MREKQKSGETQVDGRGRLTLPVGFRRILAEEKASHVVVRGFDGAVVVQSPRHWERTAARVKAPGGGRRSGAVKIALRALYSAAVQVPVDGTRITLPRAFVLCARLGSRVLCREDEVGLSLERIAPGGSRRSRRKKAVGGRRAAGRIE